MIKAIKIEHFQSWKELEVSFEEGTTLVSGSNVDDNTAEGSGKSAIFNAITWCLWGRLPKDTNIDDVISIGQKDCIVAVILEDGHTIVRSRSPNDLVIHVHYACDATDNPTELRGKDMKDTQKMINDLVGMSFETFCQSIYFPQNYEKKFITANEEEKAKILSEIQDLTIFDRASKKSNDKFKFNEIQLEKVKLSIVSIEREYSSLKSQLATLEELEKKFNVQKELGTADFKKRIDSNAVSIANLQKSITELPSHKDLKEKTITLGLLQRELTDIENKLYAIELLTKQKSAMPGICPTCNRTLDANHKDEIEIPDNSLLLDSRNNLKNHIVDTVKDIELIHDTKAKYNQYLSNINLLQTEQKQLLRDLDKLEKSTNEYENAIYLILEQLNDLTGTLETLRSKEDELFRSKKIYSFLKTGFKEIKSHVFQSLLNDLNVKSNYYIREFFDIPCSIRFTNTSDEGELSKIQTKVALNNNEYTLGLLSGGQFRRAQLAVDFAISEIIMARSNKKINMRILDEPFKDLSSEKQVKILEFLKKMPGKTLIIEHSDIIRSFVDREINIELKNGISRLTSQSQ